tara:strand:+ start:83 stop:280 length:198 start_codon:yes stop_codon:yes gene_type:complete
MTSKLSSLSDLQPLSTYLAKNSASYIGLLDREATFEFNKPAAIYKKTLFQQIFYNKNVTSLQLSC